MTAGPMTTMPRTAANWPPRRLPCVFCGQMLSPGEAKCALCGMSQTPTIRQKAAEITGEWYILESPRRVSRGVNLAMLLKQAQARTLTPNSVIKGPTTRGEWQLAGRTPGLAKHLGICHFCDNPVPPGAGSCINCGRELEDAVDPMVVLPSDSLAPIAPLDGKVPCVFCGQVLPAGTERCTFCALSTAKPVRQRAQEQAGEWYVLDQPDKLSRGVNFGIVLRKLNQKQLQPDTVISSPTNGGEWRFAARTPGLAILFGQCHACGGSVSAGASACPACSAPVVNLQPPEMPKNASMNFALPTAAPVANGAPVATAMPMAQPAQGLPVAQAMPMQGMPVAQAMPMQGMPVAQAMPMQGMPVAQAMPMQGMPVAQAMPMQGMPVAQAMPMQGMPVAQAMPMQGMPVAQAMPMQGMPVAQGTPMQGMPVAQAAPVARPSINQSLPYAQARPVQAAPIQAAPVQAAPVQAARANEDTPLPSLETLHAATATVPSANSMAVAAAPAQAMPVQAAPVQAAPIQAAPIQAAPVQAAPVQAAPVQAAPTAMPAWAATAFQAPAAPAVAQAAPAAAAPATPSAMDGSGAFIPPSVTPAGNEPSRNELSALNNRPPEGGGRATVAFAMAGRGTSAGVVLGAAAASFVLALGLGFILFGNKGTTPPPPPPKVDNTPKVDPSTYVTTTKNPGGMGTGAPFAEYDDASTGTPGTGTPAEKNRKVKARNEMLVKLTEADAALQGGRFRDAVRLYGEATIAHSLDFPGAPQQPAVVNSRFREALDKLEKELASQKGGATTKTVVVEKPAGPSQHDKDAAAALVRQGDAAAANGDHHTAAAKYLEAAVLHPGAAPADLRDKVESSLGRLANLDNRADTKASRDAQKALAERLRRTAMAQRDTKPDLAARTYADLVATGYCTSEDLRNFAELRRQQEKNAGSPTIFDK